MWRPWTIKLPPILRLKWNKLKLTSLYDIRHTTCEGKRGRREEEERDEKKEETKGGHVLIRDAMKAWVDGWKNNRKGRVGKEREEKGREDFENERSVKEKERERTKNRNDW
jgi:hypothetical protein